MQFEIAICVLCILLDQFRTDLFRRSRKACAFQRYVSVSLKHLDRNARTKDRPRLPPSYSDAISDV